MRSGCRHSMHARLRINPDSRVPRRGKIRRDTLFLTDRIGMRTASLDVLCRGNIISPIIRKTVPATSAELTMALDVEIPFGDGTITAELPDRTVYLTGEFKSQFSVIDDLEEEIKGALDEPLGSPRVEDLVKRGSRVVIAFDDPTVMAFGPIRRLAVEELLRRLDSSGVDRGDVTLICANALHRKFRPNELATMLGEDLMQEFGPRLFCHDAEDPSQLVHLGRTPEGYDVELSRHAVEADLTIYINAAYNRGFCGGWKSVCVGLSTYRSIRHHHTPDGMSMSIHENRMHAVLDSMGRLVEEKVPGKMFKLETLSANPFQVSRVFAGSTWDTRQACLDELARHYQPRRNLSEEKYDVVVYGVPNWSPYAIGASMNPLLTLVSSGLGYLGGTVQALGAPGCTVIMVTPCPDQWDRVHHAPYPIVWDTVLSQTHDAYEIDRRYSEQFATDGPLIEKYRHEYAFHPIHAILATHPLKRMRHIGQVLVAGAESPEVVEHVGFQATSTVEEAIERAELQYGPNCRIAYVPQPTVPTKLLM